MRPSLRPTALALLISAAVTGAPALWAVAAAPQAVRTPLAWGAGAAAVLLSVCVAVTVHTLRSARNLRALRAADSQRFTAETSRLVSASAAEAQRFTAESARIKAVASAETARVAADARAENERITAEAGTEQARLAVTVDRLTARATRAETERSAAVAACANAAGRMQALATSMLADLREMEHRHTDESVLGDLLYLDHRTAQAGRLADSIAVLTGARSGRRWAKPIVMESILRGAMGRIGSYQRVRLHSTSDVAIAGHAAEGVMHALAELLDNAANFSPPTAEVHVYVEEVPAGIVITVEDSGLVMSEVQLRRAEKAVAADNQDLTNLSGTRLGLAVVGRLARKHGLTVSFRPSARGGTGALMMLPQDLIARTPATPAVPATPAAPAASAAPANALPAAQPRTGIPAAAAPAVPAVPVEPEPAHAAADHTDTGTPGALPAARTSPDNGTGTGSSTGAFSGTGAGTGVGTGAGTDTGAGHMPASRVPAAPGAEAEPASESTGSVPTFGESGLPKRRRGRTLAAAEARNGNASPGGADTPQARTTDPKVQAARFSTFSRAVRANSPNPEGNTR
ncbi:ATP-binding protein [Streptomyces sp. NPDC101181]|uniref:sensor histidine kinase n=1 Tax=Streptomyces sp. NPDC101181 TaxID=3366125 RepID=UPI0037F6EA7A